VDAQSPPDSVPADRIVILEDTVELQCAARDLLAFRTTSAVSLADLLRSALRTSPSRIIIGEVRGAEALDLLDAWATGHPGGVATGMRRRPRAHCTASIASHNAPMCRLNPT
jgi:Flp pilus assembly CpaF family ATPase